MQILYQDEHYVAVHKPAAMLVHRSAVDKTETRFCLQILRDQIGHSVHPCHRLDKPTSGVLLFALDKEAHQLGSRLFADKSVRKTYRAVVRGWMNEAGLIDHPLAYIPDGKEYRGQSKPQEAITEYRCLQQFELPKPVGPYDTARYSEVELFPGTGRMHQLRRHMKHVNHHIVGDTRYGDGVHNRFFREELDSHRLLLMAVELIWPHPYSGRNVVIQRGADPSYDGVVAKMPLRA